MTTAAGPEYVPPTDWSTYRMCPVCRAATGLPCTARSGRLVFGRTGERPAITLAYPHTRRPLRSPRVRHKMAELARVTVPKPS